MRLADDRSDTTYILAAIAVFNFADYFLTLRAISIGIEEGNPYMAALIGTPWFAVVKLFVVPLGLYRIYTLRRQIGWISSALLVMILTLYTVVTVYHIMGLLRLMM